MAVTFTDAAKSLVDVDPDRLKYDAENKKVLSQKPFLAYLMSAFVSEYEGVDWKEIAWLQA